MFYFFVCSGTDLASNNQAFIRTDPKAVRQATTNDKLPSARGKNVYRRIEFLSPLIRPRKNLGRMADGKTHHLGVQRFRTGRAAAPDTDEKQDGCYHSRTGAPEHNSCPGGIGISAISAPFHPYMVWPRADGRHDFLPSIRTPFGPGRTGSMISSPPSVPGLAPGGRPA